MRLNLNVVPKSLNGEIIKDAPILADILATSLEQLKSDNQYKMHVLAKKMFKEKEFDIDDADLNLLEHEMAKAQITNLVAGQIIEQFNEARETEKANK